MSNFPKYKIVQWLKHPESFYILRRRTRGWVAINIFKKDKFYYEPIITGIRSSNIERFSTIEEAEQRIENIKYKANVIKEIE